MCSDTFMHEIYLISNSHQHVESNYYLSNYYNQIVKISEQVYLLDLV